ncbi:hypothetical protein NFD58_12585 [Staphylococcus epidermidis]|nr:hypothetical protein [Staphylococcus epidermidis]
MPPNRINNTQSASGLLSVHCITVEKLSSIDMNINNSEASTFMGWQNPKLKPQQIITAPTR